MILKFTIIAWFLAAAAFVYVLTCSEVRCPDCMTLIGEDEELCPRCELDRMIWRVR